MSEIRRRMMDVVMTSAIPWEQRSALAAMGSKINTDELRLLREAAAMVGVPVAIWEHDGVAKVIDKRYRG